MPELRLHGFSMLRNGLRYDYPFQESLASLCALCGNATLALGQSGDATEDAVRKLGLPVRIVATVWDESKRKGGEILSEQTNLALEAIPDKAPGSWGIYLQADEVFSDRELARIREDIATADREGYDCVSFRYLHFWQAYDRICTGRRWYPQEIRAIRLDRPIRSWGDAQSFRGWTRRFESEAFVYHYGHVREDKAYAAKKRDFHRWWHKDSELAELLARGERNDQREETLRYLGPHPEWMKDRIRKRHPDPIPRRRVLVFGDRADCPAGLPELLSAELEFTVDEQRLFEEKPEDIVFLRPISKWSFILSMGRFRSKVPDRMGSPEARPWSPGFLALLRFSERGISCDLKQIESPAP